MTITRTGSRRPLPRSAPHLFAGLAAVAALAVVAPAASASDDDVIRRGACSGASDWKLKASPENGRIEVEAEVDSNRVGQTWRWRLFHDGSLSARGTATTQAPSGEFEVRRLMVDAARTDRVGFRARNPRTDEVCRGALRF